jgi:hypothetical protein
MALGISKDPGASFFGRVSNCAGNEILCHDASQNDIKPEPVMQNEEKHLVL